ncbi:thioesterase family protein [Marmoricola sp. URHB0036]|uniref:thioesterase family protein n=1 Tax=Marmoricola sp. URHB0036 TaxID=1298863 RepID=UPI0004108D22|nr:thioesterase family protein [Marmoricola sp. URHB0036]
MTSFYESLGADRFASTPATAGPWSAQAQHGGPPAALLGRALEEIDEGTPRVVGRVTLDLLGPVPVAPLAVTSSVLRPGRTVSLRQAELSDESGRVLARAQGWAFPVLEGPASSVVPLEHGPDDGHHEDPPPSWHRGYLDAVEWRWVEGAVTRPGPAVVWMRPLVPLLPGEELTPLQRLLSCVDSASGASAALDPADWNFLNTELTVHVVRPPEGEWVCLKAETTLGGGSVGLAASEVYDERGLVARSAQALLVTPRQP